jgi:hypothetical protein
MRRGSRIAGCLAVLALLAPAAHAQAPPAPVLHWTALDRFGGDADGDGQLDAAPALAGLPRALDLHPVLVEPVAAACAAGVDWRRDGQPFRPQIRRDAAGCRFELDVPDAGTELDAVLGGRTVTTRIRVVDRLVVALGDSVASGEGNPVRGVPAAHAWPDRRCHRSSAAGFEQAARLIAEAEPATAITFLSYACSGATVERGLLGPYGGIEAPRGGGAAIAPQIARMERIGRPIDAVVLSVGANDADFGEVVIHCLKTFNCSRSAFGAGHRPADDVVGAALQALPGRYDALAARLAADGIAPGRVVAAEYFDPTEAGPDKPCASVLGGVTAAELRWAVDALMVPLNLELSAAAQRHGWRYVGGIGHDFAGHGYCASKHDRWVRTLSESLKTQIGSPGQARLAGTLHPNERGQLAIAARVAPALSAALGLLPPKPKPGADDSGGDGLATWAWITIAVVALLLLVLLALKVAPDVVRRLILVGRSANREELDRDPTAPRLARITLPTTVPEVLVKLGGIVLGFVLSAGFVTLVGAAILWVRFWAARVPADQAVSVAGSGEMLVVGAQALVLFGLLSVVALAAVWLIDGQGKASRVTRRGLALIVVVELLAAIGLEHYPRGQAIELIAGFIVGVALAHLLFDRVLLVTHRVTRTTPLGPQYAALAWRFVRRPGHDKPAAPVFLWRLAPLFVTAAAVWMGWHFRVGHDRWAFALVLLAVAAVLFALPGQVAGDAEQPEDPALEPARVTLAAGLLACLTIFLVRDELWLAAAALVAAVLAGMCLLVAEASETRFAPYGIAVLLSVPMFGAAVACLRAVNSPEVQPVAAVAADGSRGYCGVYVSETGGRLWLARVELAELGTSRRPRPRLGRLSSLDRDKLGGTAVGPLQPVGRAADQALVLRDELLRQAGKGEQGPQRGQSCAAEEPPAPFVDSDERRLAERFQPELIVDRRDGFWPVPVRTIFALQDRRVRVCRRIAPGVCVRLRKQGDLPWSGGDGEWIEYPARNDATGQQRTDVIDALGSVDPARTASEYFLVTHGRGAAAPLTVQFWFFYPFNYQPLRNAPQAGFHEGDFESVSVVLSARTHRPRYVWMARHAKEDRLFGWTEPALKKLGDHPTVFAARGSHASYESCDRQPRFQGAPNGLIDDRPTCDAGRQLHIAADATALSDLSRAPWACWRGLFGHKVSGGGVEALPFIVADAPRSPLWQQSFGGANARPCSGVRDPGLRDGRGEELLPDATATRLRAGAGRLDAQFDQCSDWDQPPARGAYLVACDPEALRRYVDSGLEDAGPGGLRIDVADPDHPVPGTPAMPAVLRDPAVRRLDGWRIATAAPARVDVYAACREGAGIVEARFGRVPLAPGQPLRVDDRVRTEWRLRREDGATVAVAAPARVGSSQAGGHRCTG